jgi:hypothetical protein
VTDESNQVAPLSGYRQEAAFWHSRADEAENQVRQLRQAAEIALEAFCLVEDDVRYDPDMWSAMDPLRHAYQDTEPK